MGAAMLSPLGCSGGGEREAPDARPIDAHVSAVVHVSLEGNDANDGASQPVATLERAFVLAGQHREITDIELAAGTYPTRGAVNATYHIFSPRVSS